MDQLARTAIKYSRLMDIARPNRCLPSPFFTSPRLFSTEASNSGTGFTVDRLFRTPPTGLVYGKITNINRFTTKRDILTMLDCNLTPQNVKLEYDQFYFPRSVIVEFPSRSAYDASRRAILKKDRVVNITTTDKSQWDYCIPYDGKAVLILGIPLNALMDDIERFLSGCQYDSSNIQLVTRPDQTNTIRRMTIVRFPTQTSAMHAFITKNRGFCLNEQVSLQVLY